MNDQRHLFEQPEDEPRRCRDCADLANPDGTCPHDGTPCRSDATHKVKRATGAQLRDQGIARAAAKADRDSPEWSKTALAFVRRHVQKEAAFTTEDVREAATAWGVPPPKNAQSWAAVMLAAKRLDLIEPTAEHRPAKDPKCHRRPIRVWRRVQMPA